MSKSQIAKNCFFSDAPMPFEFVNKVVTTLFHNKKKFLRTNLTKLFPGKDLDYPWKMSCAILDLTGLSPDRTAISLNMQVGCYFVS
jgi:hypothetical protein